MANFGKSFEPILSSAIAQSAPSSKLSVTAAAAATHGATAIGRLAGKPHVLPRGMGEGIAIQAHGVAGQSVTIPGLNVGAASQQQGGAARRRKEK
jgi:hypothetical protein